ncbi:hypothetical protein BDR22DRAFT_436341 [Usnea florida]
MRLLAYLQSLTWCISLVQGNVEKTIFLGPEAIQIPQQHPSLQDLKLESLSPTKPDLRRQLSAAFPKPSTPKGTEAWFLLEGLKQYQRYEVRICWAATQPTLFTLNTYTITQAFDTPDLISSLSTYSESRQAIHSSDKHLDQHQIESSLNSLLFLHVFAAAEYFTTNKTLMQNVPPVNVDIILDPFLFNILPRSLLPTGVYLIILAVFAWYLSGFIWRALHQITQLRDEQNAPLDVSGSGQWSKKVN